MNAESKKLALRAVMTIAFSIAVLFIPAGTLAWPEAWAYFILLTGFSFGIFAWLKKKNPALYRERTSRKKKSEPWDKALVGAYSALLVVVLVISGLDAVRFGWSHVPLAVRILGFLGYLPCAFLTVSVMKHNAFLSDVVRIQDDRGHQVCTTGPYGFVRHPMYVGIIIAMLMIPLSLGSLFALIPAALIVLLFILRTALEDKTLRKELPGYQEYSRVVRYRLVPGIW